MIDQWFKDDLAKLYCDHNVAVFIDETGDAAFLLKIVAGAYMAYTAASELEELHVKYQIEKSQPSEERFLIYTQTRRDALTFLREYCETGGCLEIRYLQNYVKEKVHEGLNLNLNLPKDELVAAAKVSVGKDQTYWMDLCHKGAGEIFDLSKELLPFVHDPETYSKVKYDEQLRETFYRKVNEPLGQEYMSKPAATLAGEVVNAMLDGLASGSCNETLESVYHNWVDSVTYRESFLAYLQNHTLREDIDIWQVNIHHPFRQVDERWLAEIGQILHDAEALKGRMVKVRQRSLSKQAKALGICFWGDVITLLAFDPKDIAYLGSFEECVEFHKRHFCKLDTAIRNLYAEFLHKKPLLGPFQERYKEYCTVFLDKWFSHWKGYTETQTGTLQRIIDGAGGLKTAVIVGDGVAYEVAELVAAKVKGAGKVAKDSILADIPSTTENNMSRLYMANGVTEPVQGQREKYLAEDNPEISIDFLRLEEVSGEAGAGQILICTYKDIDDMGEKLQQKALKYFDEAIAFFAEKITLLLASGYAKVYLVTDHGFVLTGLLTEADKISVTPAGGCEKAERYIRTEKKQDALTPQLIEVEKSHKQFEYLYFSRNIHPFKTPGVYGFSHGGVSPQELVTPFFCWERAGASAVALSVTIENKAELKDVTGELFRIRIRGDKGDGELFSMKRKVYMVFYANKTQVNKSDVFNIQRNERITKEYTFEGESAVEVVLLDAATKEQLDRAVVKQNKDRDLGGLL